MLLQSVSMAVTQLMNLYNYYTHLVGLPKWIYVRHWYWFIFDRKKSTELFIRDALETRLRMLIPYLSKWPQV